MAREQQQPMSDAWLAFVLEQIATIPPERDHTSVPVSDLQLLLAEVERLRAREAALMEIVRAVAEAGVGDDYGGGTWLMFSGYDAETVREQARALLASDSDEAK